MKDTERRLGNRVMTRRSAKLVDESGNVTDATILDLSPTGARVEMAWGTSLPNRFTLRFDKDRRAIESEIVWRKGTEAGLRFVSPELEGAEPVVTAPPTPVASSPVRGTDLRKALKIGVR